MSTHLIKEARELYESIRAQDVHIAQVEGVAMHHIRQLTGYESANVGSFGLLLNLAESDLDLALGVHSDDTNEVCTVLERNQCAFKGQREAKPGTVRYVYEFKLDSILIDVAVMNIEDQQELICGLTRCRRGMSEKDRIEHVFQKHILKQQAKDQEYARFKLGPYLQYCPGFSWGI